MEFINRNREELIEAWLAKTGLQPDQCQLVQQSAGTRMNFWIESRTDRCLTHRSDIERANAEIARQKQLRIDIVNKLLTDWEQGGLLHGDPAHRANLSMRLGEIFGAVEVKGGH